MCHVSSVQHQAPDTVRAQPQMAKRNGDEAFDGPFISALSHLPVLQSLGTQAGKRRRSNRGTFKAGPTILVRSFREGKDYTT